MIRDGERAATVDSWSADASRTRTRSAPTRPPNLAHERRDADEPQRRLARPDPRPTARRVAPPGYVGRRPLAPVPEPGALVDRLRPARPRARRRHDVAAPRTRQVLLDRVVEPRRVLRGPDGGVDRPGGGRRRSQVTRRSNPCADPRGGPASDRRAPGDAGRALARRVPPCARYGAN